MINEEGYNEIVDILTDDKVNYENLQTVVETVLICVQNNKEYCILYGDLCLRFVQLELNLKKLKATSKTIQVSQFRNLLLKKCKETFEEFFSETTNKIFETKDEEKIL